MRFSLTDEQRALQAEARRFFERRRDAQWADMAALGWTALTVPERYGGAGLGWIELCALLEEAGRALSPAPLLSALCLGTELVVRAGSEAHKCDILPQIADGRMRATLALAEADGRWEPEAVAARARPDGDGHVLDGVKSFVVDGMGADLMVVAARAPDGVQLFLVPAAEVERRPLPTLDATRPMCELRLDGVRVPASARLDFPGGGAPLIEAVMARARIALAAEQVGGAERCLELSVDYAKTRQQFGRPIGSFQAVKHMLADMLVRVESARSAWWWAAFCAATVDEELPAAAPTAAAIASEAFFRCAADTIQVHGGIGFTWEHDAHRYLRRARASAALFGDAAGAREAVARWMGL
jgi:alkylation response protein AidB-like acyl-CoA dehydrogenase